ncbi:MAG TPA: cupin domain-containing protein [Gammaproteobacteria bacterium]|nr:cupin domain-containing protein [Gammaproteobacteria bacterium]
MKRIMNIDEVELQLRHGAFAATGAAAERFDARMGQIGPEIGAQKLGYNLTVVPPGKRAFPFHSHMANEEMFFVLSGSGEVRIGDETYPLRGGDVVACPPGGRETAHQIENTGDVELRYLAVSTRISPEVCEYPDSDKYAVLAHMPNAGDGKPGFFRVIGRSRDSLDYWEGE